MQQYIANTGILLVFRVIVFLISRSLMVGLAFCLLTAVIIIPFAFDEAAGSTLFQIVWFTALWPWAITGRDSFTEQDIGILIAGWAVVITIGSILLRVLFPKVKIGYKMFFIIHTTIFIATLISAIIGSNIVGSRLEFIGGVLVLYIASVVILGIFAAMMQVEKWLQSKANDTHKTVLS